MGVSDEEIEKLSTVRCVPRSAPGSGRALLCRLRSLLLAPWPTPGPGARLSSAQGWGVPGPQ